MSEQLENLFDFITAGEWGSNQGTPGGLDTGVIRSANFTKNHQFNTKEIVVRSIEERKRQRKLLCHGDILIEKSGGSPDQPVGRVLFYDLEGEHTCSNFISILRPSHQADPKFLYYSLCNLYERGVVKNYQQQTTGIINLQLGEYLRESIFLPPLPEQKKIAEILSGIDQEIIRIQQQIASLEILRTAILEQSLAQLKDCPIHPLHEITKKVTVGIVSKPADHYVSKGVPTLRSMNIKEGRIDYKDLRFISEESNQFFKKSIIRKGDILTVRTGVPGTSAVAPADIDGANCVDIIISTPAEGVDSHFLCLQINSDRIKSKVLSGQGGLAQQHFNIGEMRVLDILLPSLDAQKEISSAVLSVSQCIASRCKQRSKYEGVKSAVANDLLSGRKRVSV